jgi:hypothetical protein
MHRLENLLIASIMLALAASGAVGAEVTFGPPPAAGTTWSAPGLALTEDGIDMSLDTFFWIPSGSTLNYAQIVTPPSSFVVDGTQALNTNNANAVFDFAGLGPIDHAWVEFVELGGNVNFDVNGIGLQNEEDFTSLTGYPGFNVTVTTHTVSGGYGGRIEVQQVGSDPIQKLLIGGQELGIDNVTAVPEPGSVIMLGLGLLLLACRRPDRW